MNCSRGRVRDTHQADNLCPCKQREKPQRLEMTMVLSTSRVLTTSNRQTALIFLCDSCQSNLPPSEWIPGRQWGQNIFFPAWWGFLSPRRQKKEKRKTITDDLKLFGMVLSFHLCNDAEMITGVHPRTLCSIASRLLLSFKKLSFSRWACWVICAACFFSVNSRSWRKSKINALSRTWHWSVWAVLTTDQLYFTVHWSD